MNAGSPAVVGFAAVCGYRGACFVFEHCGGRPPVCGREDRFADREVDGSAVDDPAVVGLHHRAGTRDRDRYDGKTGVGGDHERTHVEGA